MLQANVSSVLLRANEETQHRLMLALVSAVPKYQAKR